MQVPTYTLSLTEIRGSEEDAGVSKPTVPQNWPPVLRQFGLSVSIVRCVCLHKPLLILRVQFVSHHFTFSFSSCTHRHHDNQKVSHRNWTVYPMMGWLHHPVGGWSSLCYQAAPKLFPHNHMWEDTYILVNISCQLIQVLFYIVMEI